MEDGSCLGHSVDCYNVDTVYLGPRVTVSQYSFLCSASRDYKHRDMPLITAPIRLEADVWIAADVFIGPGVTVAEGAVVGARSTVMRDIPRWSVVAGSPPKVVGHREVAANSGPQDA
jgi:putative colanic acid biosynthesis acetyltransferase WcaF